MSDWSGGFSSTLYMLTAVSVVLLILLTALWHQKAQNDSLTS
jgi:hypothetical protein